MGRKIPCKKHRGVKDPLVQQAKRLKDLKGKINAPPKDPDEQPVPRSLTQLFAFQNRSAIQNKVSKIKKKPIKGNDTTSSHCANPIALLQKLPGESGRGFSLRINSAVKALHNPTLSDYPQDIEDEDAKGERIAFQRERRRKKQKKKSESGGEQGRAPKLSRAQKLALKRREKKEKALEESERERQQEVRYERVQFGEVVHAPPALPAPSRRTPAAGSGGRPGRRQLLLSAMLSNGAGGGGGGGGAGGGDRRPLPDAELERRERARLQAVAAYRALRRRGTPTSTTS